MRVTTFVIGVAAGIAGSALAALPAEELFAAPDRCLACHNGMSAPDGEDLSIGAAWQGSMMANSARDPYWHAGVRRETIDHPEARAAIEDKCASCHMPMARFAAKARGERGAVFEFLPVAPARSEEHARAAGGVACTMCHQITQDRLGAEESFTAGFVVDAETPEGERAVFGPFEPDAGRRRIMHSSARVVPTRTDHLQDPAFCAACHTLYTHPLGPGNEAAGAFPEQVPYLEWLHSAYKEKRTCQSCHMPEVDVPAPVTAVLGLPRERVSRHVFRGGNFFMPRVFDRHRTELGVEALPHDLARVERETLAHLSAKAARVEIRAPRLAEGALRFEIAVQNLAGHKLPTAYPSRRAWLHVTVSDREGRIVFASGAPNPDGSIAGNDNDADARGAEPHHEEIRRQDEVQIYEAVMADGQGAVTTGLLSAVRYLKDNRILPAGFDKTRAGKDIAVCGEAAGDADFQGGSDTIRYCVEADAAAGPFKIAAVLRYQPIGFRWARNLHAYEAQETARFAKYYEAMAARSAATLAEDEELVK